jgi:nicotinamidase-related amidase
MPPKTSAVPHVAPTALAEMIDPERCAVLVVDVQEDFAAPTGAMARMGADLSGAEAALDRITEVIAAARQVGASVAFARVMTDLRTDSEALKRLNARKGHAPDAIALCREGERGSTYYRVAPRPGDIEATKRLFNAFHDTSLEADLRARGIDTLLVAGFTTHCCVDATCRDAFHRDFNVFVISDATDAYAGELHESALRALYETCALITDTASVTAAWAARQARA